MKIIKTGLLLMFVLVIQSNLLAQSNELKSSTPQERAEAITNWMKSELSLDSTVVSTVYDINLKYAEKNQKIMSSGARRFKMFRELRASGEAKDKELKKVFTKGQYDKYEKEKAQMREKMKERMKERRQNQ